MALGTGFERIGASNNTFSDWLNKTNEMSDLFRDDVVTATSSGANTDGNVRLNGEFVANTLIAYDELRGGDLSVGSGEGSADLHVVSNTIFTTDCDLVTVEANLQVDTASLFVGNVEAQSRIEFTGGDNTLEFNGANQDFIWLSTNTYATIRTNDAGSLEFNADVDADGNDSSIELKVDSVNVASFFEGGDIAFYSADGLNQKLYWDATNEVLGVNTASPSTDLALHVVGNTQTTDLVVDNQTTSDIVVVNNELRGNTVLTVTTNTNFTGANNIVANDLYVNTNLYAEAINDVQMIGIKGSCNTASPTTIDSFPLLQSKAFKYVIHGDNANSDSVYIVEIIGGHNDTDVFFTRYGEMSNQFVANVTPKIVGSNLVLEATCSSANGSNIHNFNIIRFETR